MIAAAPPFSSQRLRRRIALFMAVAVLVAGIAQAGHFHKLEAGTHSDVHLQCLLCLYSSGSAGAPDVTRLVQGATAHRCPTVAVVSSLANDVALASYDARGPPLA